MSFAIKVALLALLLPVSLARAEQNSLESLVGTEIPVFQCNGRWLSDKRWRGPAEKTP